MAVEPTAQTPADEAKKYHRGFEEAETTISLPKRSL